MPISHLIPILDVDLLPSQLLLLLRHKQSFDILCREQLFLWTNRLHHFSCSHHCHLPIDFVTQQMSPKPFLVLGSGPGIVSSYCVSLSCLPCLGISSLSSPPVCLTLLLASGSWRKPQSSSCSLGAGETNGPIKDREKEQQTRPAPHPSPPAFPSLSSGIWMLSPDSRVIIQLFLELDQGNVIVIKFRNSCFFFPANVVVGVK